MERYITDETGTRTAVILPVEEYEALVRAAEEAEDLDAVREARARIASGEDELIPWREARKAWAGDDNNASST